VFFTKTSPAVGVGGVNALQGWVGLAQPDGQGMALELVEGLPSLKRYLFFNTHVHRYHSD
jgi:hypothetical protein